MKAWHNSMIETSDIINENLTTHISDLFTSYSLMNKRTSCNTQYFTRKPIYFVLYITSARYVCFAKTDMSSIAYIHNSRAVILSLTLHT